jgi:hypothetical protein
VGHSKAFAHRAIDGRDRNLCHRRPEMLLEYDENITHGLVFDLMDAFSRGRVAV